MARPSLADRFDTLRAGSGTTVALGEAAQCPGGVLIGLIGPCQRDGPPVATIKPADKGLPASALKRQDYPDSRPARIDTAPFVLTHPFG